MEAYYFDRLNRAQQAAYHAMLTGICALSPAFPVPRLDNAELSEVLEKLRLDHPELFYVTGFHYHYDPQGSSVTVLPDYLFDKHKIRTHRQALEARLEKLARPARSLAPLEQEQYIHDLLCRSVRYDKLKKPYSHEILGPLTQGVGVCEGIAKSVKALCDRLGLWCVVALSHNNPQQGVRYRHAWNVVRVDGAYCHLDVTFDNTLSREDLIRYDYFNLDDTHLFRDHQALVYPVPACTDGARFYYRVHKLSFTKPEEITSRTLQAIRKQAPLVFHWRGSHPTRDMLLELLRLMEQAAQSRGMYPSVRFNWPQAVLEARFSSQAPQQELTEQQANQGEQE